MVLKRLLIQNFGPFSGPITIDFDNEVTVLTGQNDTGKSSILRLIQLICSKNFGKEDDVNIDRIYESGVSWDMDKEFNCTATFGINKKFTSYFVSQELLMGDEVDVKFNLAPNLNQKMQVFETRRPGTPIRPPVEKILKMPLTLYLPVKDEIKSIIDLKSPNAPETKFLSLAFGKNPEKKLKNLSRPMLARQIRAGVERLNKKLKKILPPSMDLELILHKTIRDSFEFNVSLQDKYGGDIPIHLRGAGVRKIITLMVNLMELHPNTEFLYILFDEPENSLHADAQHVLRTLLENLGKQENIQVIYATHSPSMINPIKCEGVRLLERINKNDKATSIIHTRPIEENFYPVRASLGLSPADSLLYAPITIIVEGATEIICLPSLLRRLHDEGFDKFVNVDRLLTLTHFLDGQGASFEYWCRVAKSQGCKPIIFIDGDQIRRVRQQKVEQLHPEVPIILLKEMQEFEEIIPRNVYFQSLAYLVNKKINMNDFDKWQQMADLPERLMFTKRIERWRQEFFTDSSYSKPLVMKKALELADLKHLDKKPFEELIAKMTAMVSEDLV